MPSAFDYFLRNVSREAGPALAGLNQGKQAAFDREQELRQQALREALLKEQQTQAAADRQAQAAERAAVQGRFEAELNQRRELADRERQDRQATALRDAGISFAAGKGINLGPNKQQRENEGKLAYEEALLNLRNSKDVPTDRDRFLEGGRTQRDMTGPTTAAGGGGRMLPASMANSLGTFNAIIGSARDAMQKLDTAVQAGKNVTGAVRGRVTGPVGQFFGIGTDPLENSARGALTNLASIIMKERSGGAITPQEFERLAPFLELKDVPESVARQRLTDIISELERQREARTEALGGSGYDVRGVSGGERAPITVTAKGPGATALSDADLYEQLRDQGVAHEEAVRQVRARKGGD